MAKTPEKIPALRVAAKTEGFRRAGRAWSLAPTDVVASQFTPEQLAALRAEPMLVVADIELDPVPAAE